ncbi:hypothetical protein [Nostoc sp.]|uniref:hypothetical protein n=1 Tax=Nostoc sp. TaxID=1180 RepID=UPI002FF9496E
MTTTLTRPAWTTNLELEIFEKLLDKYAPHIPKKRYLRRATPTQEPRSPDDEERENFYRFRVVGVAQYLFIMQVCAKIIDSFPFKNQQLPQGDITPAF